jgi:hypothetical protein
MLAADFAPVTALAAVKEENSDKEKASAAPGASRLKLSLAVFEWGRHDVLMFWRFGATFLQEGTPHE